VDTIIEIEYQQSPLAMSTTSSAQVALEVATTTKKKNASPEEYASA
jgi:hypothetical protein